MGHTCTITTQTISSAIESVKYEPLSLPIFEYWVFPKNT